MAEKAWYAVLIGWADGIFNWFKKWSRKRETSKIDKAVSSGDVGTVDGILSGIKKKRKDRADR